MEGKALAGIHDANRKAALLAELKRLRPLIEEMGAREVWLFGSLARGEVREDSDLDLLVVIDVDLPFTERLASLYRRLRPQVATDLFVYTSDEFEAIKQSNPLIRTVLREGKRL